MPQTRDRTHASPPAPAARRAFAGLALTMLLASLSTSSANIALPTLAQAFAAPFPAVQWVVLAYLVTSTALVVGAGRIGDLFGRRRLLRLGLLLFAAASTLCALSPSLGWLIAARALQGLGGALMMALALALAGEAVPKERLGRAMGLLGTLSAVGTALGPSLGGLLIDALGWQAVFLAGVPLAGLALWLVGALPADRPSAAARPRFDTPGALLLALALAAYALGLTLDAGPATWVLLPAALLALAGFVAVERRRAAPLISLTLLREPGLGAGLATLSLVSAVVMATLVIGPFHLTYALGLDTAEVGLLVAVGPLVVALTAAPAGRLVDRLGPQPTMVAGLVAMALGCTTLAVAPLRFGWVGYVLPLAIVTAGYALFQTANNSGVMGGADPARRGLISGLLHLARNLGLVTGTAAMGALFLRTAGDPAVASPQSVALGTTVTFAAAAGIVVVALTIALGSRLRASRGSAAPAGSR